MSELPIGWEWSTVDEVASTSLGKMLDKKRATGLHPTPYLRNVNVRWGGFDLSDLAEMDIAPDELDRVLARPGDVIACEGGEPGRSAVWRGPGAIALQKALHRIRPTSAVEPAYLVLSLQHLALSGGLERFFTGTTIKHLPQEKLRLVQVPLPPKAEQKRIVAAMEEHLSRLDAADAALAANEQRLSMMRRSLIEDLARGPWAVRTLGDVLVSLRNGCFVSRPSTEPPGLAILRISAVRPLALDVADIRYAPHSLARQADYRVRHGDVLFTRYSGNPAYVGACATVPAEGDGLLHPDKLIRGVPDASVVLGDWIALAVSAATGRREIEHRLKTTAGQVGIAGSQLRTVPIPLPPLAEQRDRIARWRDGIGSILRLRSEIERARRRAKALRQSILAAAFAGRLVAQDLGDEPAGVLLERIRAGRAAAGPMKRARKAVAQ